ncbi:MAG: RNA-binding S4 domain-containing protein [Proteobacteria bacterium]|nr:RNA-binding S4 domain-containing protein [Pseudomonadota bacterium]
MLHFDLEDQDYIELNKLLKVTGLCDSGGMANTVIVEGAVSVDGEPELRKRCKIRAGRVVEYNDQRIQVR